MATASAIESSFSAPRSSTAEGDARYTKVFWAIVAAHVVVWTVVPSLVHPNLPLDSIEMNFWGSQWEWGYHKHPPLPAWMMHATARLTGGAVWGHYLAVQLCVAACFWAAWCLGKEMLPARYALVGAAALECCCYYNYEALTLNNNTAMYPFWALAVLMLYWAVRRGGNHYWAAAGAMLGLGLLCKYVTGLLALNMLAFGLLHPKVRNAWLTPGPYLMLLTAAAVFGPHLAWAIEYGFPPLKYAMARTAGEGVWYGRLLYPLMFGGAQLLALIPLLLTLNPITGWRWRARRILSDEHFNRDFLLAMCLGPIALHLLLSFGLNMQLKSMYGSQLFTFAGITLLFFLQRSGHPGQWQQTWTRLALVAAILVAAVVGRNLLGPYAGEVHREHFPGRELATEVEAYWGRHQPGAIPVLAGDGWLTGNAAYYGTQRPQVFGIMGRLEPPTNQAECGWMDDLQFARSGGIVLWYADEAGTIPAELRDRFPRLEAVEVVSVEPHTIIAVPSIRIGMAIVPGGGG